MDIARLVLQISIYFFNSRIAEMLLEMIIRYCRNNENYNKINLFIIYT